MKTKSPKQMPKPSIEGRVEELELQAAYTQRSVNELDGVVRECADELTELRREVESLRQTLKRLLEGDGEDPDELPTP